MEFNIEKLAKEFSPLILNNKKDVVDSMLETVELKREVLKTKNARLKIQKENFIKETVAKILHDINEIINYRMENIELASEDETLEDVDTKIIYKYEFYFSGSYKDDEFKEMIIAISKIILSVMLEKGYMDEENKGIYVGIGGEERNDYISVDFDLYKYDN